MSDYHERREEEEFAGYLIDPAIASEVQRMSRDIAQVSSDQEARFLADQYYIVQNNRKRTLNQVRAAGSAPTSALAWLGKQDEVLEQQIRRALSNYTKSHPMGQWMRQVYGIGPIIAGGLLAYCDIEKQNTAGKIWAFAGWAADGQKPWKAGEKRPYSVGFRTLCYQAGLSFLKFSAHRKCFYGHKLLERKAYEIGRNDSGALVSEAKRALSERNFDPNTEAWAWYQGCYPAGTTIERERISAASALLGDSFDVRQAKVSAFLKSKRLTAGEGQPMLPPAHILARSQRWAAKLFLAHMHEAWYWCVFGKEPPLPFAIGHLSHVDRIDPPIPRPERGSGAYLLLGKTEDAVVAATAPATEEATPAPKKKRSGPKKTLENITPARKPRGRPKSKKAAKSTAKKRGRTPRT